MTWRCGVVAAAVCCAGLVYAGPIAPSAGPVGETYKTLTEVEPRIAVNAVNTPGDSGSLFVISQPGSYYLTGNVVASGVGGVRIGADGVTLDLNGFSLVGDGSNGNGVWVTGKRCVVRNGSLSDWYYGVSIGSTGEGARIEGVNVRSSWSGVWVAAQNASMVTLADCASVENTHTGFLTTPAATLIRCDARANGDYGFSTFGRAIDCYAEGNNLDGFIASEFGAENKRVVMRGCVSIGNGGSGIRLVGISRLIDCVIRENEQHGIWGAERAHITGCQSESNLYDGITVGDRCTINGNDVVANGWQGVVTTEYARVENNHVTGNGQGGIRVEDNSLVLNNSIGDNGFADPFAPGINVAGGFCRIEGNMINGSTGYAIYASSSASSLIVRNSLANNDSNTLGLTDDFDGGLSVDPTTAGPWVNFWQHEQ
jgi:parallel beta-helix repeat protein